MYKLTTLPNGLTLITINLPHLDSVTTLLAVGAGSRYENRDTNGISHFLEHMFFKGSKKYPSAEEIATMVDGIGAINNAATSKEFTYYWIKSSSKNIDLATDILSSMIKESLLASEEIEREKGVIAEELRMYRDNPARYIWELYERLQFGDQPLGWDIGGSEKVIGKFKREDFINYVDSLYAPSNMVLVFCGNLPKDISVLVDKYFATMPRRGEKKFVRFKKVRQERVKVDVFYKKTDQVNLILGVESYSRYDKKRYAAKVLSTILGEGMSSRLFIQVRERRGLAYHIASDFDAFKDTGYFAVSGGIKLEKIDEGIKVIIDELAKIASEGVSEEELKKGKEMIRGRLSIKEESTNFLAEYFAMDFILDRKIETFADLLNSIDKVTTADVQSVAKELFISSHFNLQIIGPFKDQERFIKVLS